MSRTWVALLVVTLVSPIRGDLVANNSGSILFSASNPISSSIHPTVGTAVTLQDAAPSLLVRIESFSTLEFAPVEAPAFAAPLTGTAAPIQEWFAGMGDEPDSSGPWDELAPVPEPSTWCAGLLALTPLLWPLCRRLWARQRTPLDS